MGSGGDSGEATEYPYSPARVLAQAHLAGLSYLCDLFRERAPKDIAYLYDSTRRQWQEARDGWEQSKSEGRPDFSHITRVERHLRRNFNTMIWETTARFGNREWKRVKSERVGQVGPMNKYLNMAGAQLRDYGMTRFSFPEPEIVGRRGRRYVAVYEDPLHYCRVEVNHTTMPELDFVDMVRAPVFELARKCFINNVPMTEARRYVNLLLRRLSPFLEYLYTSGESGRWGFKRKRKRRKGDEPPDADQILRQIVLEIEALYGGTIGRPQPPTHQLSSDFEGLGLQYFLDQVTTLRYPQEEVADSEYAEHIIHADFLKDLCLREILRDVDAKWISEEARRRARWYGITWHRMLTNGYPQPFSLRRVILEGDGLLNDGEGQLLAAEVPVTTELGEGRADLVVFNRQVVRTSAGKGEIAHLRPVAVFDIKTKSAFNWSIKEDARESKKHGNITVPAFTMRRRSLTEREWTQVTQTTPDKKGEEQLALYAQALKREYTELTGDTDETPLVRGTIVVDAGQEASLIQSRLRSFVLSICDQLSNIPKMKSVQRLIARLDDEFSEWLRLAVVIEPVTAAQQSVLALREEKPADTQSGEDDGTESTRNIILYLSARANTRSGPTAAWIAQYWDGLEYIRQSTRPAKRTVWLDLSGDFSSEKLARRRLHISGHPRATQELWDRIEWMDVSQLVDSPLYGGGLPEAVSTAVSATIGRSGAGLIVVSGWEELEESTPQHLAAALRQVHQQLVRSLSGTGSPVLWFASPDIDATTSSVYQGHRLRSPSASRPFEGNVREVIWDLPVKPYAFGQMTPLLDDLRVIIHERDGSFQTDLAEVPCLRGWSSRFWTQKRAEGRGQQRRGRVPLEAEDVLNSAHLTNELAQSALGLLSHHGAETISPDYSVGIKIEAQPLRDISPPIVSPLTYQPRRRKVRVGKGYAVSSVSVPEITHPRGYREQQVKADEIRTTTRSPALLSLEMKGLGYEEVYRTEMRRVKDTLDFLTNLDYENQVAGPWYEFLDSLNDAIETIEAPTSETHLISRFLKTHPLSSDLWESLLWTREGTLLEGVGPRSRRLLGTALSQDSRVVSDTGTYLVLLLLAVTKINPSLGQRGIRVLWEDVKSWYLMQLELRISRRIRFNVRSIWSRLCRRAEYLLSDKSHSSVAARGKVMIDEASDGLNDFWLVVEDPYNTDRLLSGVWRGMNPFSLDEKMHWGLVRHDDIAASVAACRDPSDEFEVMIVHDGSDNYLWMREEIEWQLLGRVELVRRGGQLTDIRGMRITGLSDGDMEYPTALDNNQDELGVRIQRKLEMVEERAKKRIPVKIALVVDKNEFVISLIEDDELIEEVRTMHTAVLLHFLRGPLVGYAQSPEFEVYKEFYTWNPYEDIDYGELEVVRPYVERRKPLFGLHSSLPANAVDFSSLKIEDLRIEVVHDESVCPIALGESLSHDSCWRVRASEASNRMVTENLNRVMTDLDIFRLYSAGEIILGNTRYQLQIEFSPDPVTRDGVVFRESGRIAWLLGLKRIPAGTYSEMNKEKLICSLLKHRNEVQFIIRSDKTDDRLYSWLLFKTDSKVGEMEILEAVDQIFEGIMESYFNDDRHIEDVVSNYDDFLADLKEEIGSIKGSRS